MENRKVKVQLTLELPKEDLKDAIYKVAADGTNLSELLEGFISDLVCGAHHGSDECDRAISYYDRCSYGLGQEDSFLRFLLKSGYMDEYLELLDDIKVYQGWELQDGQVYDKELAAAAEEKASYYEEWTEGYKVPTQSIEEAYQQVEEWAESYKEFMKSCEKVRDKA